MEWGQGSGVLGRALHVQQISHSARKRAAALGDAPVVPRAPLIRPIIISMQHLCRRRGASGADHPALIEVDDRTGDAVGCGCHSGTKGSRMRSQSSGASGAEELQRAGIGRRWSRRVAVILVIVPWHRTGNDQVRGLRAPSLTVQLLSKRGPPSRLC